MGIFNYWPYTNLHELNLNWIITELKKKLEDLPEDFYTRLEAAETDIAALKIITEELSDEQLKRINLLPPQKEYEEYKADTLRTIASYLAINNNARYLASGTVRNNGEPVVYFYSWLGYLRQYAGAGQSATEDYPEPRARRFVTDEMDEEKPDCHLAFMDCSTFMSLIRKCIPYGESPYWYAWNYSGDDQSDKMYDSGLISYTDFNKAYLSDIYGAYQTYRDAFIEHQSNNRIYQLSEVTPSGVSFYDQELIDSLKTGDIIWIGRKRTDEPYATREANRFLGIYHVGFYVRSLDELNQYGIAYSQTYKAADTESGENGYVVSVVDEDTDAGVLTINTLTYWINHIPHPENRIWERVYFNRGWSDNDTDSRYSFLANSIIDEGVLTRYVTEDGNDSMTIDRSRGQINAYSFGSSGLPMSETDAIDLNDYTQSGIWERGNSNNISHAPANEVNSRITLICYGFGINTETAGTQILIYESASAPRIYYRHRSPQTLVWNDWALIGQQSQSGSISTGSIAAGTVGSVEVTFPRAFNAAPVVMCTPRGTTAWGTVSIGSPTTTGFTLYVRNHGTQAYTFTINWMAMAANRA